MKSKSKKICLGRIDEFSLNAYLTLTISIRASYNMVA